MCAISSLTSTFAISSPDEFLLLFLASKLIVVIHSNCVCKTIELMLENISSRVVTTCNQLPAEILMWSLSLKSFARAI